MSLHLEAQRSSVPTFVHDVQSEPINAPRAEYLKSEIIVIPTLAEVTSHMQNAGAITALTAKRLIDYRYMHGPISERQRQNFEVALDVKATPVLAQAIHMARFRSNVISSEGEKEKRKYGIVLPLIRGVHGFGELLRIEDRERLIELNGLGNVELVLDPIEGTKRASRGDKGASVMIGGSIKGGLPEIPDDSTPAIYSDRIVASPRVAHLARGVRGFIDRPISDVVELTRDAYHLSNAGDIKAVVLRRPRNEKLIADLRILGINPTLIQDGDAAPALQILTSDMPMISLGGGGKDEAADVLYAAKAVGGFYEGRYVGVDGQRLDSYPDLLRPEDLPGDRSDYFMVIASITGIDELGLAPVAKTDARRSSYNVNVGVINSRASYLQKEQIPL